MVITHQCVCGCAVTFSDPTRSYINNGGALDDKGRRFIVEVKSDEWYAEHKRCRNALRIDQIFDKHYQW